LKEDQMFKTLIHVAVGVSVAVMPVGYAEAAKRIHKTQTMRYNPIVRAGPVSYGMPHNAAAESNDANGMSGPNSAVENAIGRTNCC
jgi:hypothetical protein